MRVAWRSSPILSTLIIFLGIAAAVYLAIRTPLLFPIVLLLGAMAGFILHKKLRNPKG